MVLTYDQLDGHFFPTSFSSMCSYEVACRLYLTKVGFDHINIMEEKKGEMEYMRKGD